MRAQTVNLLERIDFKCDLSPEHDVDLVNLACITPEKLERLEATLATILTSSVAEETYAQLIDGNPTRSSFYENYGGENLENTNVSDLDKPSSQAIQSFQDIRASFSPLDLSLDVNVRSIPRWSQAYSIALLN